MSYKAVIFDLDNTLLDYSASELKCMQRTVQEHGLLHEGSISWEHFWTVFGKHNTKHWLDRIEYNYKINQVLDYSFRDALTELGLSASDSKRLSAMYWNYFCQSSDFEQYCHDILTHLHGKYRLAVVSNGIGEAQRSRMSAGGIKDYFEALIFSDEAGCWKPDKRIFETALGQLKLERDEVLFIGDSIADDYHGSLNAGIDFCFYNRSGQPLDSQVKPKLIINSLSELMTVLG